MPILGTVASQFSSKPFGSFDSIATATVGAGGSSTVSFTSIPATYKHLQIRYMAKDTYSAVADFTSFGISGNGTNTWRNHYLMGDGADPYAGSIGLGLVLYATPNSHSSLANRFGVGIIDVLDYADTNKNKTFRILNGEENNTNNTLGRMTFQSLLKVDTTAISSLTFTGDSGFAQYTQFSLYGIKGA
jgi:hypothetical protein